MTTTTKTTRATGTTTLDGTESFDMIHTEATHSTHDGSSFVVADGGNGNGNEFCDLRVSLG